MSNPIYIEHSIHDGEDAYKIDLPWGKFAKDTRVLCKVSAGYDYAKKIAAGVIVIHLMEEIKETPKEIDDTSELGG